MNDDNPVIAGIAKCGTCVYYGALNQVCRKEPPKAFPIPSGGNALTAIAIWVPVDKDRDWCGEYRARDAS